MIGRQLRSIRGFRAAVEQWRAALAGTTTVTARAHVLDGIRAHMERLQLPHRHLDNWQLDAAVAVLHELVLDAPRLPWQTFIGGLCEALRIKPGDIGDATVSG